MCDVCHVTLVQHVWGCVLPPPFTTSGKFFTLYGLLSVCAFRYFEWHPQRVSSALRSAYARRKLVEALSKAAVADTKDVDIAIELQPPRHAHDQ